MRLVLSIYFVSLFFSSATLAEAQYLPNKEILGKVQTLIGAAPKRQIGFFIWREIRAGTPGAEGNVAYFMAGMDAVELSYGGISWQLEEWRLQPDGSFLVTYTKMWPERAIGWSIALNPDGSFVIPRGGVREETLDITSEEVIRKSELAQELLLRLGHPVVVGGEEA